MSVIDEPTVEVTCRVNGVEVRERVAVRRSLVDWLRHDLGLTGSHVGCEQGSCGACHVVVAGKVVRGCLMLAVQADGEAVETIETPEPSPVMEALRAAFFEQAAVQCGFCTPGMILQAAEFLTDHPRPSRQEIREALSGNFCRCTGYHAIVDAVQAASRFLSPDGSDSSNGH